MCDNRDLTFMQKRIDTLMDSFKNQVWNEFLNMSTARTMEHNGSFHFCPTCGRLYTNPHAAYHPNFCEECGQAFDWPEGNDDSEFTL